MGNYIFNADVLIDAVLNDGERTDSTHDMGGDIVTDFVARGEASVYDLNRNIVPGSTDRDRFYWRDVGSIDSFFEAHQDLISALPVFNLYNTDWPIFSQHLNSPPAKFVRDALGSVGTTIDSIVSPGSVISGAHVERSVLGPWVSLESGAMLVDSIVFERVHIGPNAVVRKAILDKDVVVARGPKWASTPRPTAPRDSPSPTLASRSSVREFTSPPSRYSRSTPNSWRAFLLCSTSTRP